jgi:hypothetical protein
MFCIEAATTIGRRLSLAESAKIVPERPITLCRIMPFGGVIHGSNPCAVAIRKTSGLNSSPFWTGIIFRIRSMEAHLIASPAALVKSG